MKAYIATHPLLRGRAFAILPLMLLLILSISMICPVPAYAAAPWDLAGAVTETVCGWLLSAACSFFNLYGDLIAAIGDSTTLTSPFSSLLGNGLYNITTTIHQSVVVPIAESILALFMLVQIVKISQRIDATATLPAVKDIVFLAVTYVLLHWFILHSLEVMQAIYQIAAEDIIPHIGSIGEKSELFEEALSAEGIDMADVSIGSCITALFASLITLLTGLIAYVVSFVVAYARAWQIYVMAAFSSIPVALLGFDETRQSGIGFLKNFTAAVLAGAIMMFLLVAYPYILTSVTVNLGSSSDFIDALLLGGFTDAIKGILTSVALSLLLVFGLVKSGAWAKELLGN